MGTVDHGIEREREVRLEHAFNVRDLGGLRLGGDGGGVTRSGLLYRADSLDSVTESDERVLFGELRIGTIIDLRTPEEAGVEETASSAAGHGQLLDARHFPGKRTALFPLIPDGRIGIEPFPVGDATGIAKLYLRYISEHTAAAAGAVELMIDSVDAGVPALFHCAAGRDRTGALAAVLLGLLGVADEEIVADYELSNARARQVSDRLAANPLYRADEAASAATVNLVDPATMQEFLRLVQAGYGTFRAWAISAGIAAAGLDRFRAAMTGAAENRPGR